MQTILKIPQGSFAIQRLPLRKKETLKAWDAADEYLLQHLSEQQELKANERILILNDRFGALAVALHQYKPVAISDSWLSQQATRNNLKNNKIAENTVQLYSSMCWPEQQFDLVLIKVPKTLALLEDQLIRIQALLTQDTRVIAAGMVKAMPSTVWKMLGKYLGPNQPSLARKKARLIFVELNTQNKEFENPYPVYYQLEKTNYKICNHANVFSRDSLDIGSRFLLQNLPQQTTAKDIVDLGCGNGVVGLMLAENHPLACIHFVDESFMAVASAKENFFSAFPKRKAVFYNTDGLTEFDNESMDIIVCNPPFHQQSTIGSHIAISMFKHAHRVLRKNGELWVIGNRHLAYHIILKKIYAQVLEVAANKKFVIWQVKK